MCSYLSVLFFNVIAEMQIFGGDPFFSSGEAKAVVKYVELQPCLHIECTFVHIPVLRDVVM
jgi:hypothetical protein